MLAAKFLQDHLYVDDMVVIAHGYTFDRHTVDVWFEDKKLVRIEEVSRDKWEHTEFDYLDGEAIFHNNIKRWYKDKTNNDLIELFESFGRPLPLYQPVVIP